MTEKIKTAAEAAKERGVEFSAMLKEQAARDKQAMDGIASAAKEAFKSDSSMVVTVKECDGEDSIWEELEEDGIDIDTIPHDREWWAAFAKLVNVYVALDPVEQKAALKACQAMGDEGMGASIAAANEVLVANGREPVEVA